MPVEEANIVLVTGSKSEIRDIHRSITQLDQAAGEFSAGEIADATQYIRKLANSRNTAFRITRPHKPRIRPLPPISITGDPEPDFNRTVAASTVRLPDYVKPAEHEHVPAEPTKPDPLQKFFEDYMHNSLNAARRNISNPPLTLGTSVVRLTRNQFSMSTNLSTDQINEFREEGYLIVPGLFDAEEARILHATAKADQSFEDHAYDLEDSEGGKAQLVLWNKAGEDLWGSIARCERIVNAMEQLLEDEVYHYHSKMSIKRPRTGGAWSWHQDYGYWYQNGCLYPDLASAFIAIDPNTRANGCMQVLKGSHKMGRIEHGRFGDQTGADPERVAEAVKVLETVYVELDPGDVLFFHSNTLHRSDQNTSETPRWSLLCCYNTRHNNPYKKSHHPFYERLEKLPDSAIKEMGSKLFESGTEFWDPANDETVGTGKG